MLTKDQASLLDWLEQQPEAVAKQDMEDQRAPGYTSQRVEDLREVGHLIREIAFYQSGHHYGIYRISDKGKAALSEFKQQHQDRAEHKAERKKDRKFQLLNTLLGAFSGAFLTLLIEHFDVIVKFLLALFQ